MAGEIVTWPTNSRRDARRFILSLYSASWSASASIRAILVITRRPACNSRISLLSLQVAPSLTLIRPSLSPQSKCCDTEEYIPRISVCAVLSRCQQRPLNTDRKYFIQPTNEMLYVGQWRSQGGSRGRCPLGLDSNKNYCSISDSCYITITFFFLYMRSVLWPRICRKLHFRPGLRPEPHWGSLRRSPRLRSRMRRGHPSADSTPLSAGAYT